MFKHIGVVGAGLMGSEIALVFALAGRRVKLNDSDPKLLDESVNRLERVLQKGIDRELYAADAIQVVLPRIQLCTTLKDYSDCDLVVEAVYEDERVKSNVFKELDRIVSDECIIASNTSSISITTLASQVSEVRRARFIGTHFFSPVSKMRLVEVIPGLDTDGSIIEEVMSECRDIGKTPIEVKDVVGFAVNRLLHAMMIEATRLVEEGVATPEDIDVACRLGLGHPIGPFQLMDATQISLSLQVQEILCAAYGDRFKPRPIMKQMVGAGYNGKRSGRGWYKT
ncbi:MAG: 3-hydroxyacyl-CoA dehydrogenase family protein [Burkholderiales bacterium]|nr:MAG: 3-hydroxyacyl-CoA dehydrogenase [Betaproteobacteria bacterium TMED22]|tara:strand:+ start:19498 stop:20346 length:849 start_codon:yes stop_codon:yes gene_type:complete